MTDVRLTQIAVEAWLLNNPQLRLTQLAIEQWAAGNPALQLTQVAVEAWGSVELGRPPMFSAGHL